MTATDTQPVDVPDDEWRGRVTDSQNDELPIDESVPRRREARALLGSLLRPYRLTVALLRSSWWWKTLPAFRFRYSCNAASTTASRRSCPAARRTL